MKWSSTSTSTTKNAHQCRRYSVLAQADSMVGQIFSRRFEWYQNHLLTRNIRKVVPREQYVFL